MVTELDFDSLDTETLVRLAYALYVEGEVFDSGTAARAFEEAAPCLRDVLDAASAVADLPSPCCAGDDEGLLARRVVRAIAETREGAELLRDRLTVAAEPTMSPGLDTAALALLAIYALRGLIYVDAGRDKDGRAFWRIQLGDRKTGATAGGADSVVRDLLRTWLTKLSGDQRRLPD